MTPDRRPTGTPIALPLLMPRSLRGDPTYAAPPAGARLGLALALGALLPLSGALLLPVVAGDTWASGAWRACLLLAAAAAIVAGAILLWRGRGGAPPAETSPAGVAVPAPAPESPEAVAGLMATFSR